MNIVNTNIIGSNVLLAIVNVFGDWQGNLAFGQPDLWVGTQASVSGNPLTLGSTITYHVTVTNRGTADATGVTVQASDSAPGITSVIDPGGGIVQNGPLAWNVPTIAAGATDTFTYTEQVNDGISLPPSITETVSATENEDDANPADNTDAVTFALADQNQSIAGGPTGGNQPHIAELSINEGNNTNSVIAPGSSVHYRLFVQNNTWGGPASNVLAHETLYGPMGNVVSANTWKLGYVGPEKKFLIQYDTDFASSTPTGWYISYSSLSGTDVQGEIWQTKDTISSSSVYIVNPNDSYAPPPPTIIYAPYNPVFNPAGQAAALSEDTHNVNITSPQSAAGGKKLAEASVPAIPQISPIPQQNADGANTNRMDFTASIGSIFSNANAFSWQNFLGNSVKAFSSMFRW